MKKHAFPVLYMFFLTFFFTAVVSAVKEAGEERIARNQQVKLQRVVLHVLGMTTAERMTAADVSQLFAQRVREIEVKGRPLYIGYAEDGRSITGYAFPVGGQGFWGPILGLAAVDPSATELLGVAFFKHSETPGLGARITEDGFTKQFRGLRLYPIGEDGKFFHLTAAGTGRAPKELDAITGATGTSRAVEGFLNKEFGRFLEAIRPALEKKG